VLSRGSRLPCLGAVQVSCEATQESVGAAIFKMAQARTCHLTRLVWPWSVRMSAPEKASHSWIAAGSPPETIHLESGEKAICRPREAFTAGGMNRRHVTRDARWGLGA
jgi:hypothetical protein